MRRPIGTLLPSPQLNRLCALLLLAFCLPLNAQESLSLLTWSDYIAPQLIRQFEREFNARVEIVNFDNEDQRDRKMTAGDGRGFDLILVNHNSLPDYIAMNWLARIDPAQLSQFRHIDPRWRFTHKGLDFGLPYLWGTVGIAWRSDRLQSAPNDWSHFYRLAAEQKQPVEFMENHRDLMGTALLALGHSVNSDAEAELKQAAMLIKGALDGNGRLNNPILNRQAPLVKGDVHLAMMYNGDALFLAQLDANIHFKIPESGTILWVDYWAIARHSRNRALSHHFLDFISRPSVAAKNSEYLHYASTNLTALKQLKDSVYENPMIYPPKSVIERAEVIKTLAPTVQARYQDWYHWAKYGPDMGAESR